MMKTLKTYLTALALLVFIGVNSQNSVQDEITSSVKTFEIQGDQGKVSFQVKVDGNVISGNKVTKFISVDADMDNMFERIITVSYPTSEGATLEVTSTTNGFSMKVQNRKVDYDLFKSTYYVSDTDRDFFKVNVNLNH